jgi:hypothetical protein
MKRTPRTHTPSTKFNGEDRVSRCFRWLDQVRADPKITGTAFKLAYIISQGINQETGLWYASRETLADKANVGDVKTISRLTHLLQEQGHVTIEGEGGRNKANVYRLVHKHGSQAEEARHENGRKNVPVSKKPGHFDSEPGTFSSPNRRRNVPPTNLNVPTSNTNTVLRTDDAADAAPSEAPPIQVDYLNLDSGDEQASERVRRPEAETSQGRLWREGLPILIACGVRDRQARGVIGLWMRDTNDDADRVLDKLREAKEAQIIEPVAWITKALQTGKRARPLSRQDRQAQRNADALAALMSLEGGRYAN